jgi:hypothetical protein
MNVSSETLTTTALLASWLFGAVNAPPWMACTAALIMAINSVLQIAAPQGQFQDVPLQRFLVRVGVNIACALLVYEAGLFTWTLA